MDGTSPSWEVTTDSEQQVLTKLSANVVNQESEANEGDDPGRSSSIPHNVVMEHKQFLSGPLMPDNTPKIIVGDENR